MERSGAGGEGLGAGGQDGRRAARLGVEALAIEWKGESSWTKTSTKWDGPGLAWPWALLPPIAVVAAAQPRSSPLMRASPLAAALIGRAKRNPSEVSRANRLQTA
ncbi:hypothetical protein PCL_10428 [Purpureocillium lilacinum]|uniref:Uncharacterized protein n=1 Tax=Purpureocillium lilacinum TaxID=33203 RepID=A0A2U3EG09_PURLI|nr:hypothetical protein PCL_10428 [Purpureocillium lilacinum]